MKIRLYFVIKIKMQAVHLKIRVLSPLVENIDFNVKSDAIIITEMDDLIDYIFNDFKTVGDSRRFYYSLYVYYQEQFKHSFYGNKVRVFTEHDITVPLSVIALCLPRYMTKKYFNYDCMTEKYYLKDDFLLHLKKL